MVVELLHLLTKMKKWFVFITHFYPSILLFIHFLRLIEIQEDDLKWIDENIPETLAEGSAALIDSDDEVMNTKYEMSKME